MSSPPGPRSRRTLLRAGGLALVAVSVTPSLSGCGIRTDGGTGVGAGPAATGDAEAAERLARAVERARATATAAARESGLEAWRDLALLHRRHARELPAVGRTSSTATPTVPAARRAETTLVTTSRTLALSAESGVLALLAASVAASIAQRRRLSPALGLPRPATGGATVRAAEAAVPTEDRPVGAAGDAHASGLAAALAAEHAAIALIGSFAARLPAATSTAGHDRLVVALARHRARRDALALSWPEVARSAPAAPSYRVPPTRGPEAVIAALATVEQRCADAYGFLLANAPARSDGAGGTGGAGGLVAGDRSWAFDALVDAAVQVVDAGAPASTWPGRA